MSAEHAEISDAAKCLVAGSLVVTHKRREIIDPATERTIAEYFAADHSTVDAAVRAAQAAHEAWRSTSLDDRRVLLSAIADILVRNCDSLSRLLTLEQGKPLAEARAEIQGSAEIFRHYASAMIASADSLFVEVGDSYERVYAPLGVVAGLVPWNFPLLIAAMKVAPALLAGNAIIVKPAPTTPLVTMEFGRLCADTVPSGLLQILGDDGGVGPILAAHPGIQKISFTGSTLTGRKVMASASETLKRLTLELGGNDPAVVLADTDPHRAVAGIYPAVFTNSGQVCGAIKRLYVHDSIFEDVCDALAERATAAVVGHGLCPDVTMGPLQNKAQFAKACELLADAKRRGRMVAGGTRPKGEGYFLRPTLVVDLDDSDRLVCEEQFAPILPILRFSDESEAFRRANRTIYGLTASIWSSDLLRAKGLAASLNAGLICVNMHNENPLDLAFAPSKQSGIGYMYGDAGLKEYLQPHLIRW